MPISWLMQKAIGCPDNYHCRHQPQFRQHSQPDQLPVSAGHSAPCGAGRDLHHCHRRLRYRLWNRRVPLHRCWWYFSGGRQGKRAAYDVGRYSDYSAGQLYEPVGAVDLHAVCNVWCYAGCGHQVGQPLRTVKEERHRESEFYRQKMFIGCH